MASDVVRTLLFDERRPVTALTLSRHAEIPVKEASEQLTEYYDTNKGKDGLWAIYSVVGKEDDIEKVLLVKDSELEHKTKKFSSVRSKSVFSLQACAVEDMWELFLEDNREDADFFVDDIDRATIRCSRVVEERKNVTEHLKKRNVLSAKDASVEAKPSTSVSTATKITKLNEPKKMDMQKMFQKACTREKTPNKSPLKAIHKSPFDSPRKKTEEESPLSNKKRGKRKILLDEEDDSDDEPTKTPETATISKKKDAKAKQMLLSSDEDEDTRSHASPEKMEEGEAEEGPKKKGTMLRRSPLKTLKTVPHAERTGPAMRKEMAVETFLNEEGLLERREVVREVEVEEEPKKESVEAQPVAKCPPSKASTKKAQTKISAFFTKK